MRDEAAPVQLGLHVRVRHGLRRPHNWLQLVRFTTREEMESYTPS